MTRQPRRTNGQFGATQRPESPLPRTSRLTDPDAVAALTNAMVAAGEHDLDGFLTATTLAQAALHRTHAGHATLDEAVTYAREGSWPAAYQKLWHTECALVFTMPRDPAHLPPPPLPDRPRHFVAVCGVCGTKRAAVSARFCPSFDILSRLKPGDSLAVCRVGLGLGGSRFSAGTVEHECSNLLGGVGITLAPRQGLGPALFG